MDFVAAFAKNGHALPFLPVFSQEESAWTLAGASYCNGREVLFPSGGKALYAYDLTGEDGDRLYVQQEREHFCVHLFHGYILDGTYMSSAGETYTRSFEDNWYGTYARGCISDQGESVFATDELGMSPLYYADTPAYLLVGNAPHLMAMYLQRLSIPVHVEEQLPMWYVTSITVESDCTGYREIKRLRPYMMMRVDANGALSVVQTHLMEIPKEHKEAVAASLKSLDLGITALHSRFSLSAQLTGGFDSRLVLAILLRNRLACAVPFSVTGSPGHPDVVAAKKMAEYFGLELRWQDNSERRVLMSKSVDDCLQMALETDILTACEKGFVNRGIADWGQGDSRTLSGFCAEFSRPILARNYLAFMRRRFRREVDITNLSPEELAVSYDCLGYSDNDRYYLTDDAWEAYRGNRRYIFDTGMERFHNVLDTADSLHVYRMRSHHGGYLYRYSNMLLLNNPLMYQVGRTYTEPERRLAKYFFELIYHAQKKLTFFPLENRVWDPICYAQTPVWDRLRYRRMKPISSELVIQDQLDRYEILLPWMKAHLLDALPASTFTWVKRDALEQRLASLQGGDYGRPAFTVMNLVGYAQWYQFAKEKFPADGGRSV